MSNSNDNQIKVGLFVALGLVVIVSSIFVFGGDKAFFQSYYTLRTRFDSVQGLAPGSSVTLAGLPIGRVVSITLVPDQSTLEVTVDIQSEMQNRITENSVADVRTQGALGDKYIYIDPGKASDVFLKDGQLLASSMANDVLSVISNSTDSVEKFFLTIEELYKFTASLNEKNQVRHLMDNLVEVSGALKTATIESQALMTELRTQMPMKELKGSATKLDSILAKLDKGQGTLGALINDKSLHTRLNSFLGEPREKKALNSLMRSTLEKSK